MPTQSTPAQAESTRRVALASMIGTSIEWYDFFIFGTASALVFGELFFPNFSELAGTLAAFASFAVGFVARPVGGLLFGHIGDRVGRKTTLVVTLTMMGVATFLMGLMPTFATIGIWAPILMVLLRFVQGMAVGGEWGGAVLMAVEHSDKKRRGFFGSFAQVGSAVGGLLATGMFLVMQQLPEGEFLAWGWRVPFLISIVLVGVGLFIRLRITESPEFTRVQKTQRVVKVPVVELLRRDARNVLLAAGLYLAHGVLFYAMTVYTIAYTTKAYGLEQNLYLVGVTAAGAVQLVTIPLMGILSDRLGRRRVVVFGTLFIAAFAIPLNFLITSQVAVLAWVAVVVSICIGHNAVYSPTAALYSEMFPAHVRYSGASIGYQFGGAIAGFVPLIATSLVGAAGGAYWPIPMMIAIAALIGFVCILLVRPATEADPAAAPAVPREEVAPPAQA
ncbi:MFS transporter [Pseudonocardia zijingensis]|uniref:MFS transporter n=2 Tax=Pseudonocardia zijingensis TaxID=153376 RepID=A0ABN1PV18_9PSEU